MFNSISWSLFIVAVLLVTLGYYCISTSIFFRNEFSIWLKSFATTKLKDTSEQLPAAIEGSVIGPISKNAPQYPSLLDNDHALSYTISEAGEEIVTPLQNHPGVIVSVAELIDQIKEVLNFAVENHTSNDDFKALLTILLARYQHLKNTSYREAVSFFIFEISSKHFSPPLTKEEVLTWWG